MAGTIIRSAFVMYVTPWIYIEKEYGQYGYIHQIPCMPYLPVLARDMNLI